ncbi:MAG TPA: DUF2330 domain-containing protein [Polyangiaceae bacterium]|nr:DUF2330 domain-containing protein [Polyangiaceae bacterium]
MRTVLVGVLGAGVTLVAATARDAEACGGCFHPPSQSGTVVTDHRMIFSVSPSQTTLYDEIEYSGSPSDFAWVLPIHGQVSVGLSSDLVFSAFDSATQTTILAPPFPCAPCNCFQAPTAGVALGGGDAAVGDAGVGVTVIAQQVVGPYATVQLHPNSTTDTAALTAWLTANSYTIPSSVQPIIAAYVSEGFDFLAIRLRPGQGVKAMRPVSVTTPGAGLSLPLRMVAAGTGATVGISLWVVGSGRYEAQNFPNFTISPSDLVWDWSKNVSNYTTLRAQKEASFNSAAWQTESSLDLSPYQIDNQVLQDPTASAYMASSPADGGVGNTPIEARQQDLATLFPMGSTMVRVTRMRADLTQAALANDLVLQAASDQTAMSNQYQAMSSINAVCQTCSCGGGPTSGAGSSGLPVFGGSGSSSSTGGASGFGAGGGSATGFGTGSSGGVTLGSSGHGTAPPAQQSFSCATTSSDPPGAGFFAAFAGIAGVAVFRSRARRRRATR